MYICYRMSIKKHIPNFITILNLLSGCIAIVAAFDGMLVLSAYLVVLAAILDFLDGMLARALGAISEIGKQLDSLADVISFGVAPGVILFCLMSESTTTPEIFISSINIIPYLAFLIPAFSAIRLAKFNVDSSQSSSFRGLPTPANALLIASFPMIISRAADSGGSPFAEFSYLIEMPYFLVISSVVLSYLLISRIKLFSLKFKTLEWNGNSIRYIFLIIALILLFTIQCAGIPIIILLYILLSLLFFQRQG